MFPVLLFIVAFRYPTANRKILTLLRNCPFRVKQLPIKLNTRETRSLPHLEHDSQWRVNDFISCIMGNLRGDWMQTIINEVLAIFKPKKESDMLAAPF